MSLCHDGKLMLLVCSYYTVSKQISISKRKAYFYQIRCSNGIITLAVTVVATAVIIRIMIMMMMMIINKD